ncbi:SapC family protein [Aliiglaciecola sp.]|nr:SapC family protein [Aliiglaciecola sp.]
MSKLVALNPLRHRQLKVDTQKAEEYGADLHMIPVVVNEFAKLVAQFPILFTKNADTGQFSCVALTGFEEGENLFWNDAQFDSVYIPLTVRRQPFFVSQDEQAEQDYVMCINEQSRCVSKTQGQSLFDENGQATDYLAQAQNCLSQLVAGEQQTHDYIHTLSELNVLVPLSLEFTFVDGQSRKIQGLYSIDEDKIKQLSGDTLESLNQSGVLQLIYTQLASLAHIYVLLNQKNKRLNTTDPWFNAAGE